MKPFDRIIYLHKELKQGLDINHLHRRRASMIFDNICDKKYLMPIIPAIGIALHYIVKQFKKGIFFDD